MAKWLDTLQHQGREIGGRALDRHLRLGVTGLSGAGKTAFITSLVHQLTEGDKPEHLPFFSVVQQGRYLGGKIAPRQVLNFPRFPYEHNFQYLIQQPPAWPPSTEGCSQLSLNLRYKAGRGLRAKLQNRSELALDIIDYPGEWLLDLPMLQWNYRQWCEFSWDLFNKPHRRDLADVFKAVLTTTDLDQADELSLQKLTDGYKTLLAEFRRAKGTYLHQPGRLLVPGELAGAPMLQLFPLLPSQLADRSALLLKLEQHYESYRNYVIKPFYKTHFARLDRQIILVDCLSALNLGYQAISELQDALRLILQSFQYGPSSLLRRLFKPSISKVVFAASKVDHVTPEQHKALTLLLQQLLHQPLKHSQYQSAITEAISLAAIRASEAGNVMVGGESRSCISGVDLSGRPLTVFPGDVPRTIPLPQVFIEHQFQFPQLLPRPVNAGQLLPHIRMDHVLQFLLEDKFK